MKRIILASASPRRKELLAQLGFDFIIHPADMEESVPNSNPADTVKALAFQKAACVADFYKDKPDFADYVVLGSDTVVSLDNKILGKPRTKEDAFSMLKALQDNTHQVYTGVSLIFLDNLHAPVTFSDVTKVTMFPVSDEEIHSYIASGEPMDKAGSYGIQGLGGAFIQSIEGDYNTVVGLPVSHIYQILKKHMQP